MERPSLAKKAGKARGEKDVEGWMDGWWLVFFGRIFQRKTVCFFCFFLGGWEVEGQKFGWFKEFCGLFLFVFCLFLREVLLRNLKRFSLDFCLVTFENRFCG